MAHRFEKWIFGGLIVFVLLILFCAWLVTPHTSNNVRPSSPLQHWAGDSRDFREKIREKILDLLPMGSDRSEIDNFIKANFYSSSDIHFEPYPKPEFPYFSIEFSNYSTLWGGDEVAVLFLLDQNSKLHDVRVEMDSAWL